MEKQPSASLLVQIGFLIGKISFYETTIEHFGYLVHQRGYVLSGDDIREVADAKRSIESFTQQLKLLKCYSQK